MTVTEAIQIIRDELDRLEREWGESDVGDDLVFAHLTGDVLPRLRRELGRASSRTH